MIVTNARVDPMADGPGARGEIETTAAHEHRRTMLS